MKELTAKLASNAKKFVRQHLFILGLVVGLAGWLIPQAISGVVGNSAYYFVLSTILPWLAIEHQVSRFLLILLVVASALGAIFVMRLFSPHMGERSKIDSILDLEEYSKPLQLRKLRRYYEMISEVNKQAQTCLADKNQLSLYNFIDRAFIIIFNHMGPGIVNGGGIILRDPADHDWLSFWRMSPDQAPSPKRFFIGPNPSDDNHPRGAAGNVYLNDSPQTVTIIDRIIGKADNPYFHYYDLEAMGYPRSIIPYESFLCLPIHWKQQVLGVISIESQQPDTFNDETAHLLQPLADQIGSVLALCKAAGVNGYDL